MFSFELSRLLGLSPRLTRFRSLCFPLYSLAIVFHNFESKIVIKKKGMSQPPSQASWPAGIPEIRLHTIDLDSEELVDEAKGWLLFVRVW